MHLFSLLVAYFAKKAMLTPVKQKKIIIYAMPMAERMEKEEEEEEEEEDKRPKK